MRLEAVRIRQILAPISKECALCSCLEYTSRIKDRKTDEERIMELDGVFVQIGLAANSAAFRGVVEMNRFGEIGIDSHCRTNVPGI